MDFLLVHTFTESLDKDRVMYYVWLSVFYWLQASAGKESTCNAGDLDSISGLGRSPGGGPTPVFLPGESPRTEETDRIQSMGLQSIGHD